MTDFIGRKTYLEAFEKRLSSRSQGEIIRYSGRPSIGKSTLLREFKKICVQKKYPFINMAMTDDLSTGYQILHNLSYQAKQLPSLVKLWEKVQENIIQPLANPATESMAVIASMFDPSIAATQAGVKLLNHQLSKGSNHIPQGSEQPFLDELKKLGKKHPVCFFDSYEHVFRSSKTLSRIEFNSEIAYEFEEKECSSSLWIKSLALFLAKNGWIVIMAGRFFNDRQEKVLGYYHSETQHIVFFCMLFCILSTTCSVIEW